MEYSDLVKEKADDLLLRFSRHRADVSLLTLKGTRHSNMTDKGTFAFDLSELSEKEKSHVLSLAEETLKFSYTFKIKGDGAKVISYERNVLGIPVSLAKSTIIASVLFVGFLVLTFLYLLFNWFVF
jgi:hypothetical protein